MITCALCDSKLTDVGVVCSRCIEAIAVPDGICPEQITSSCGYDDGAWLIDRWGRPHPIAHRTVIGRRADFEIHCASVSRLHAVIEKDDVGWQVVDLSSRNGSYVDGHRVLDPANIGTGSEVRFGTVAFLVLLGSISGPISRRVEIVTEAETDVSAQNGRAVDLGICKAFDDVELIGVSEGRGGLIRSAHREERLTEAQFELVRRLCVQYQREESKALAVRGFLPSATLIDNLPWSTRTPDEINLRHLVRRVRRRINRLGLTIEGRHGFGYRICKASPTH